MEGNETKTLERGEVQKLLDSGYSHQNIADQYKVSKSVVTRFIQNNNLRQSHQQKEERTEQPTAPLFGLGAAEVLESKISKYYLDKRIAELEKALTEAKDEINDHKRDLNKLKNERDDLQRKLDTFEEKKSLEIQRIQLENQHDKSKGINGLADKFLSNEKLVNVGIGILAKKFGIDMEGEEEGETKALSGNTPLINSYLEKVAGYLNAVDEDTAGKLVTVMHALAQPVSEAALNNIYERATKTEKHDS